jgi:hypothetical protein
MVKLLLSSNRTRRGCLPHKLNLVCGENIISAMPRVLDVIKSLATLAGTKSRKRAHRLLQKLNKHTDRRVLDSDGQRWGERLRVLLLLFSPSKHADLTWDTLEQWLDEELALAVNEDNNNTAQLVAAKRALQDPVCKVQARALHWLFGDVAPLLKGVSGWSPPFVLSLFLLLQLLSRPTLDASPRPISTCSTRYSSA